MQTSNQCKMRPLFASVAPLSETQCSAAGFTNFHLAALGLSKYWSGELMKTLTPGYQIRSLYKELPLSTQGETYFFFLEKETRLALSCWSFSSPSPPPPPPSILIPSFSFICLSCRQWVWPEIKNLSCLFARCQHKAFPIILRDNITHAFSAVVDGGQRGGP